MMLSKLPPKAQRLAALGILLLFACGFVGAIAWPTWSLHRHYDSFIDDSRDKIVRYRRVAAMRPAIEEGIAKVEKRQAGKDYWSGATPALTASEIQSVVTRIVESHHGTISSMRALPVESEQAKDGIRKVGVSIQLTAATVPLQLILYGIESNRPFLFVDNLTIRSNAGRNYKATPGVEPEFSVNLTMHGFTPAREAKP